MYRQAERRTGRQKDEQAVRKMCRQTDRKMNSLSGRCTGRQKDEQPVRKMYRQAER
jgi:hypothetical protein